MPPTEISPQHRHHITLYTMTVLYAKGPPGVPQSSPVHPSEHTHLMSSEQLPFLQEGLQTVYREVGT